MDGESAGVNGQRETTGCMPSAGAGPSSQPLGSVGITPAQVEQLRSLCARLAHCGGGSLPPHLETLPDLLGTLGVLTELCAKRIARLRSAQEASRDFPHELEDVERLKARFIRNVSHELRTPLACIDGFARALLQMEDLAAKGEGAPEVTPSPETRRQFLSIISQEAQRLGKLIEDVLDLSDIEADRRPHEATLFDAKSLVDEAVAAVGAGSPPLKVALRLKPDGVGPPVYADRAAMVEVLRQLLLNAHRFSAGQEIVVGAEVVSIKPDQAAPAAESGLRDRVSSATLMFVRDNGVGIPKDELPFVFEKFYRGRQAASLPGAGLGLAIMRSLVNRSNGRVWVNSTAGRGSTFYVLLPNHPPGG